MGNELRVRDLVLALRIEKFSWHSHHIKVAHIFKAISTRVVTGVSSQVNYSTGLDEP